MPRPTRPIPDAEWAWFMARLTFDGEQGAACADVVRRFVAGEIEVREQVCPERWEL